MISFFLQVNSVSLYRCTIFSSSMFLMKVLLKVVLGRFHFLTLVNRTTVNIPEQVCVEWDGGSFGYVPRSGLADHMVDLFFLFEDSPH